MKAVVMLLAAVVLATVPAQAQGVTNPNTPWMGLPSQDNKSDHTPEEHTTVKADEKAYRSALDGVPQSKGFDPWRNVRASPKSK